MTPTLLGRWQTRMLLLSTVGILTSTPFALGLIGGKPSPIYFLILMYVAIFGLGWDILYNNLQKSSWDRDWPAAYQLFAGIGEFIFVLCGVQIFRILPVPKNELPLILLVIHYIVVWLSVFITSQSIMRIAFPRWRFRGGKWL
jgi:hypothetical protein